MDTRIGCPECGSAVKYLANSIECTECAYILPYTPGIDREKVSERSGIRECSTCSGEVDYFTGKCLKCGYTLSYIPAIVEAQREHRERVRKEEDVNIEEWRERDISVKERNERNRQSEELARRLVRALDCLYSRDITGLLRHLLLSLVKVREIYPDESERALDKISRVIDEVNKAEGIVSVLPEPEVVRRFLCKECHGSVGYEDSYCRWCGGKTVDIGIVERDGQ